MQHLLTLTHSDLKDPPENRDHLFALGGSRAGIGPRGRARAGATLIPRGEFSIVIAGIAVASGQGTDVGALAIAYVLVLAVVGPVAARFSEPIAKRMLSARPAAAPDRQLSRIRRAQPPPGQTGRPHGELREEPGADSGREW